MGWTESPPAFSGATETIADLANAKLVQYPSLPEHRLKKAADHPADGYISKDKVTVQASSSNREYAWPKWTYVLTISSG